MIATSSLVVFLLAALGLLLIQDRRSYTSSREALRKKDAERELRLYLDHSQAFVMLLRLPLGYQQFY